MSQQSEGEQANHPVWLLSRRRKEKETDKELSDNSDNDN